MRPTRCLRRSASRGERDERGAFLAGMAEYVTSGPDSLDDVLDDIEAAWPD